MSDYAQPGFYRFNEDSLKLVHFVKSKVNQVDNLLDLGAGSGIIGLELARFYLPGELHLVELQSEFLSYLEQNIQNFSPKETKVETTFSSFKNFNPMRKFDLIVSNPPYYLPGRGQASSDPQRDKARTFREDGWIELLSCIERSLSRQGKAFIVIKNDSLILKEARNSLPKKLKLDVFDQGDIMILELVLIEDKEK